MGKSSDQIREEIVQQRTDAGAKIDQLQSQIENTAQQARDQVMETADQVRGEAKALVTDTVESVKETFNLQEQVQQRPLVTAAAAMVGGFLLGSITGGENGGQHRDTYHSEGSSGGGIASGIRSAAQKSGFDETISNAGAALMGSITEQLKSMLDQSFPGFSEKLDTAQHESGSFTDKAKATQHAAQQY